MSPDAAAGHGLVHQAALYDSDEQFQELVIPFVHGGLEAGEPTLVALHERHKRLVESVVTPSPGLSFLPGAYDRPVRALRSFDTLLKGYLSRGTRRVRFVGEVPHPGVGVPWEWWARYEATINHVFARFPLWSLCLYDRRTAPDDVLADVTQTHPYLATPEGHRVVNECYTDPAAFLTQGRPPRADPLETTPPAVELVDPAPDAARRAIRHAARTTHLSVGEVEGLAIAVSETVTNAACHGRPPTQLLVWTAPERIVVTVTDQGSGPADPFAGLLPSAKAPAGGLGLWLTHQLCNLVTLDHREDGFTVRLIAGNPRP